MQPSSNTMPSQHQPPASQTPLSPFFQSLSLDFFISESGIVYRVRSILFSSCLLCGVRRTRVKLEDWIICEGWIELTGVVVTSTPEGWTWIDSVHFELSFCMVLNRIVWAAEEAEFWVETRTGIFSKIWLTPAKSWFTMLCTVVVGIDDNCEDKGSNIDRATFGDTARTTLSKDSVTVFEEPRTVDCHASWTLSLSDTTEKTLAESCKGNPLQSLLWTEAIPPFTV